MYPPLKLVTMILWLFCFALDSILLTNSPEKSQGVPTKIISPIFNKDKYALDSSVSLLNTHGRKRNDSVILICGSRNGISNNIELMLFIFFNSIFSIFSKAKENSSDEILEILSEPLEPLIFGE